VSRKRHKRKQSREKTQRTQLAVIVGVLVLVGVVLILKSQKSPVDSANSQGEVNEVSEVNVASPVAATAAPAQPSPTPTLLPEAQLDQLLAAGKPTLAFFHSNTCVQCVRMTEIVQQVYPDFADAVALVDVNVYDERNRHLPRSKHNAYRSDRAAKPIVGGLSARLCGRHCDQHRPVQRGDDSFDRRLPGWFHQSIAGTLLRAVADLCHRIGCHLHGVGRGGDAGRGYDWRRLPTLVLRGRRRSKRRAR
jgi:hypothetical protein